MNKRMMSAILALLMICSMCMHVLAQGEVPSTIEAAEKHVELPDGLKSQISASIQSWAEDNYGEHYTLSGYEDEYYQSSVSGSQVETNVMVSLYTTLKYKSVEDLPYMQGVKDYLNANSLAQVVESDYASSLSKSAAEQLQISEEIALASTQARSTASAEENILSALPEVEPEVADKIVRQISDQYVDAAEAIGQPTALTLDLHVTCSYDGAHASNILLQYVNIDGTYDDIDILALPSKEAMRLQASESLVDEATAALEAEKEAEIAAVGKASARAYANYDRIAARDYALTWSSNATKYCNCGDLYGVDYSKWNKKAYPYTPILCHNDCADFVSQALHAGGIPTSDTWCYGQVAWFGTISLHRYFTNMGYWSKSTFAVAAAGSVAYIDAAMNHVMMVTLNDTVTHRFTAHTQDRLNCQFTNNGEWQFYVIRQ